MKKRRIKPAVGVAGAGLGLGRANDVLRATSTVGTHVTPLRDQAGFHLMGTARMGTNPARSLLDGEGRCHDAGNLFIADSSIFVTSSVCNPTATAARRLHNREANGGESALIIRRMSPQQGFFIAIHVDNDTVDEVEVECPIAGEPLDEI